MPVAFATVTLRVECKSNWSEETPVSQIRRQAIDDAIEAKTHQLTLSKIGKSTLDRIESRIVHHHTAKLLLTLQENIYRIQIPIRLDSIPAPLG